jgi:hypothetical protein
MLSVFGVVLYFKTLFRGIHSITILKNRNSIHRFSFCPCKIFYQTSPTLGKIRECYNLYGRFLKICIHLNIAFLSHAEERSTLGKAVIFLYALKSQKHTNSPPPPYGQNLKQTSGFPRPRCSETKFFD